MIRLVIADDHALIRESLCMYVAVEEDMEIVGTASDGVEAVELVQQHQPDVVLLDIQMPKKDGIQACREIRSRWPHIRIGLLTGLDEKEMLFESLLAGADSFVSKDAGRAELMVALRRLAAGDAHLAGQSLQRLITEYRRLHHRAGAPDEPPPSSLSQREREVLTHVLRGKSNKEMARLIGVEISTVKSHLHNAFGKLGVQDRTQAAVLCLQHGWFCSADHDAGD